MQEQAQEQAHAAEQPLWVMREGRDTDIGYVLDSWLHALLPVMIKQCGGCQDKPLLDIKAYWKAQPLIIQRLLNRATITVACNPEMPDHIFGYVIHEQRPSPVLHWIGVKAAFRGFGLGRELFTKAGGAPGAVCSHITDRIAKKAVRRTGSTWSGLIYDPFSAWI